MRIWLYGRPFSGKTTFVSKIPNSVILSTDGNASGLFKDEDIVPIRNIDDLSKFMSDWTAGKYKGKTAIIVDVDVYLYDIIREYTLEKNKINYESDLGYAKGWRLVSDAEWFTFSKLARLAENVVFISHEDEYVETSSLGKETTKYRPALNAKMHDKMTGLMTVVCRAVVKDIKLNDTITRKYYISIGSDANELSGTRVKLKSTKIENSWDEFMNNIEK